MDLRILCAPSPNCAHCFDDLDDIGPETLASQVDLLYTCAWLQSPYASTAIARWEMLVMKECCHSRPNEQDIETKLSILESEIKQKRQELVDLLKSAPRYALANYQFADHNGG